MFGWDYSLQAFCILSSHHVTTCSRVNPNPTDVNARQTIKKAYEFALNHVGQDKDSGEIWRDYIDFLKSAEARGMQLLSKMTICSTPLN